MARVEIKESKGKPLSLQAVSKEDNKPLAGASIMGRPTAELPPVMWRALARRCGVSNDSGSLACSVVPLALQSIDVVAPQRRRARVAVPNAPDGPLRAVLAPYQNLRVAPVLDRGIPAKLLDGLTAVVARCERPPCDEAKAVRKPLPAKSRTATFSRLEPGKYQVWLETPSVRSSGLSFDVAADSDAVDTAETAPSLQLWQIAVYTHLKNGEAVPAHIWLGMYWEGQREQEFAGDAWTEKEGRYERYLLAESGGFLTVHAYSDTPRAEGMATPPGVRLPDGGGRVFVELEMLTSGGKVKLIDKDTKQPIAGCSVDLRYWGPSSGGAGRKKTDAEGVVGWLGVSKGWFRADASCDGYRPASTGKVEVSEQSDPTILELESAAALRLRVRDAEGNLLPGAAIYLEQAAFEVSNPFLVPAELLGATDFNGEIAVPAWPKTGLYVLAPRHALHVGRLPLCPDRGECISEIRLSRPAPFPGIRLKNPDGGSEPPVWLVFLKDGVPIPVSIQSEVLRLNGGSPSLYMVHEGADIIHMLPGLFGPGVYDVGYAQSRAGTTPLVIPLATLAIPATQRLELTAPDAK